MVSFFALKINSIMRTQYVWEVILLFKKAFKGYGKFVSVLFQGALYAAGSCIGSIIVNRLYSKYEDKIESKRRIGF